MNNEKLKLLEEIEQIAIATSHTMNVTIGEDVLTVEYIDKHEFIKALKSIIKTIKNDMNE